MLNNMELKAKLIMTVRDYECQEIERWDRGVDFTAFDGNSNHKTLLRIVTEPHTKSGVVGVRSVREMAETMEEEQYDKGIALGGRFSAAAKRVTKEKGIELVSDKFMPPFNPQNLYLKLQKYVDDLCKAKCGMVPEKESDCEGYSQGDYTCQIRRISDNAAFHFERGWTDLLQKDFMQLLAVGKSMNESNDGDTNSD